MPCCLLFLFLIPLLHWFLFPYVPASRPDGTFNAQVSTASSQHARTTRRTATMMSTESTYSGTSLPSAPFRLASPPRVHAC